MRKDIRSERFGPVEAEVSLLPTEDGLWLSLTRLGHEEGATKPIAVLVHGTYTRRNFWISPKGIGLGPYLAERGFEVWIPELRGHGLSPKTERFREFCAEDHIRRDLPAIQALLRKQTGQKAFWVGHSAGGLYTFAALGVGWLDPQELYGAISLGSQISRGDAYLRFSPLVSLARLSLRMLGHFPAPLLGWGPEIEPVGEIFEYFRWKERGGSWTTQDGRSYWEGLRTLSLPALLFAGAADRNDPPEGCKDIFEALSSADKRFVVLGRQQGYSMDYGHTELIVSKAAQGEVWPTIAEWMLERYAP